MKNIYSIFLAVFIYVNAFSQTVSILDVDYSNFPTMKAKICVTDSYGEMLRQFNNNDFKVSENDIIRKVNIVQCPNVITKQVSLVNSFDASGSMSGMHDGVSVFSLSKKASSVIMNSLKLPPSEAAIHGFSYIPVLHNDFTTDRAEIESAINKIQPQFQNDFYLHLMHSEYGLLPISNKGKYKKIALLHTDAWGPDMDISKLIECVEYCKNNNIVVYVLVYSYICIYYDGILNSLKIIAKESGGEVIEGVTDYKKAIAAGFRISEKIQNIESCYIEWESEPSCKIEKRNVEVSYKNNIFNDSASYITPSKAVSELNFSPKYIRFLNPEMNRKLSFNVNVKSVNSPIKVDSINISNELFDVVPKSFYLDVGQSIDLTFTYTAIDSSYNFCKFELFYDLCSINYFADAGWKNKKSNSKTLNIISPNGGESYIIGSDSTVIWEGVSPEQEVIVEYSIDKGDNWEILSENAKGLKYVWEKIPAPQSNNCLIRVTQGDVASKKEWEKSYGGTLNDIANSIIKTSDGGYVVAGGSMSKNNDVTQNKGAYDFWIFKIDEKGLLEWQKSYGGSSDDIAYSIVETEDKGFLVVGYTESSNGDVTSNHSVLSDYWVIKLNQQGDLIWQKNYGGKRNEIARSVFQTKDGNYVIAGTSESNDGDVDGNEGPGGFNSDFWVIKIDKIGNIIWNKTIGGTSNDNAFSMQMTKDEGFVVVGLTFSNNINVPLNKGSSDYLIVKVDKNGVIEWSKSYGGKLIDNATSITQAHDNGYVVVGYSNSIDGDITVNRGFYDYWVLKLDIAGNLEWQKTFGGTGTDIPYSIVAAENDGYIIAGTTDSKDFNVKINKGSSDIWITKLNNDGSLLWQKTFGGSSEDVANCIINANDGGYVVAGYSASGNGDLSKNYGGYDSWILKLGADDNVIQRDTSDNLFSLVEPVTKSFNVDMGKCIIGSSKDSLVANFISNVGSWDVRIDSVYIKGNDADAFKNLFSFKNQFLKAGLSLNSEFRFAPKRIGIHNAEIVIVTQNKTITQGLTGEGIEEVFKIENQVIDFGKVLVGSFVDSTEVVLIKNISTKPIHISKIQLSNTDQVDFKILSNSTNIFLNPNESLEIDLRFEPSKVGMIGNTIEIISSASNSPILIYIYGEGITNNHIPKLFALIDDFKQLYCENSGSSYLQLYNIGDSELIIDSLTIAGLNPNEFSLDIIDPTPIKINPFSSKDVTLTFNPITHGFKSAEILVFSNDVAMPMYKVLTKAKKTSFDFSLSNNILDFGFIKINNTSSLDLTIKNNGDFKNNYSLIAPIDFLIPESIFELDAGEEKRLTITYSGSSNPIELTGFLTITENSCSNIINIAIDGNVYKASANLVVDDIEAFAGQKVRLVFRLNENQHLDLAGVSDINAKLLFNPTLLYPVDYEVKTINNKTAEINIDQFNLNTNMSDTVKIIDFICALGNAEQCELTLTEAIAIDGEADIKTKSGIFRLLGICQEGGPRLINVNENKKSIIASPNPANSDIIVQMNLIENGNTYLYLFDQIGEVKYSNSFYNMLGEVNLKISTDGLSSGIYYLNLRTPTFTKVLPVVVVK